MSQSFRNFGCGLLFIALASLILAVVLLAIVVFIGPILTFTLQ